MSRSPCSTDHATHHLAQQSCSNPASTNGTSGASADFCFNGQVNARTLATRTASKWTPT
ncbi:hypothetical protein [Streptomyces sp. NRRL F-5630]|uniref:hypothetical protein n=1 Tax=Streptomyces sp. NRRL F-5630 TaxID=1463864 RepID=UPI003D727C9F